MQSFEQFGNASAITIAITLINSVLVAPPAMTDWSAYRNMRMRRIPIAS